MKSTFTIILGVVLVLLTGCSSVKIPTIYDAKKYGCVDVLQASASPSMMYVTQAMPNDEQWMPEKYMSKFGSLDKMLEESNTTAFVVVKDGKVYYEKYANGIGAGDLTQIFSVTKTIITTTLALALEDGYIESLDQPVSDFIPAFKEEGLNKITLYHLAQMQSGLNYDEYKRVVQTLKFYHQKNILPILQEPKLKAEPGTVFKYKSIDTQLLGVCIETALGRSFLDYINERLFSKLGFQDRVEWSVDSKETNNIKYYGGLNISARDLAKYGVLIANNGKLDGKQVLNPLTSTFCNDASCRNIKGNYCNGWWYDQWDQENDVFYGAGFKGQILMINRTSNVVIVRLGENKGGLNWYSMMKKLTTLLDQDQLDIKRNDLVFK